MRMRKREGRELEKRFQNANAPWHGDDDAEDDGGACANTARYQGERGRPERKVAHWWVLENRLRFKGDYLA